MAKQARITAVMFAGTGAHDDPVGANVAEISKIIDQAALDAPDLVVLPECFNAFGIQGKPCSATAEPIDGPTVTAIAAKAKEHQTYVACPIYEKSGPLVYNASVLIDRKGTVVGVYRKMWPTTGEIAEGVTPGSDAFVADTDFGKVGFAICFDLNFRPVGEANQAKGAKLTAFSSMYRGGLSARIWAYDFACYLVSSTPSEMSHFCDPLGRVLGDLWTYQPIMTRQINLDFEVLHIDENNAKWPEIRKRFGKQVELDIVGPEGVFMMTSHHPQLSVEDIIREMGLEPRKAYFERSTRVRSEAIARAAANKSAHLPGRSPYAGA